MKQSMKILAILVALICLSVFLTSYTWAAQTTGMPWEGPIDTVRNSLSGPVAYGVAIISILAAGFMFMVNKGTDGILHTILNVAITVSIMLGAVTIINAFFPSAAGLVF